MRVITLLPALGAALAASTSNSTGIRLAALPLAPGYDLSPPVRAWRVGGLHVGAGLNAAVLAAPDDGPASTARVFYLNGTSATLVSDGAPPTVLPFSLLLPAAGAPLAVSNLTTPGVAETFVNAGAGSPFALGPSVLRGAGSAVEHAVTVPGRPGAWLACVRTVLYYQREFVVLAYVDATPLAGDGAGSQIVVPERCAPVDLLPLCAGLEPMPEGAVGSHKYAVEVACYSDLDGL